MLGGLFIVLFGQLTIPVENEECKSVLCVIYITHIGSKSVARCLVILMANMSCGIWDCNHWTRLEWRGLMRVEGDVNLRAGAAVLFVRRNPASP